MHAWAVLGEQGLLRSPGGSLVGGGACEENPVSMARPKQGQTYVWGAHGQVGKPITKDSVFFVFKRFSSWLDGGPFEEKPVLQ